MNIQGLLNLDSVDSADGHSRWLAGRRLAVSDMARRLNLPLGQQVEVCLRDGVCLRGQLRLREEILFIEEERVGALELQVGRTCFNYSEIESCVRLD